MPIVSAHFRSLLQHTAKVQFHQAQLTFYQRDVMPAQVLAMALCLSVCLSVSHKSEFDRNGRTNRTGFGMGASFHLSYTVLKEIRVYSKIRVLPSGTLSQTPDLENFASVYRLSKRVINLA